MPAKALYILTLFLVACHMVRRVSGVLFAMPWQPCNHVTMATVTKLYLLMGPRRLKDITRLETALMVPFSHCLDYKGHLTELQLLQLM